jgi:dTDP-4-dehydrorhamnose reductase
MKVMITGAYGQLGTCLKEMSASYSELMIDLTDYDTLDITDRDAVSKYLGNSRPDFVVNCAAYTAVDKAENDHDAAHRLNALGPENLSLGCRQTGARLIHISTDYVFDGSSNTPYSETHSPNPKSVYGKTKLAGERLVLKQLPESVIIRTSWLYSAHGNNFVKTMIRLGQERNLLKVVFDQTGTPTYAGDLAKAILKIISVSIKDNDSWNPGVYHFSNLGVCSWYDFAVETHKCTSITCKVEPILSSAFPTVAPRPSYSVLDKSKIQATYGLEIPYWRDSLMKCIQLIQKQ